ncbi:hypothetical protein P152DRAFT_437813 [Eremomyces bilateralis CBS 781.70]|uniref:UBX domain-containing protein n=1 Tax=Eremomyces bilateralis CBS 781.70 TaxID=1392243 RepID=A0A6G1G0D5_9PEZI|nr:uncharacterized protein P152DRAFT_437813 [Eremomyces bilateralis CBS 781.70]KAF1811442.1 hypothetical protein P152DRAFT_437813 [Eremomyces bilateralis CBS 781.70]
MAPPVPNLDALTDIQRDALQQYRDVTNQDVEAAIPVLERSQWNVQFAISRFFDGEPASDPVADALAQPPQPSQRQETLMNGFSNTASSSRRSQFEPAPRVTAPSATNSNLPVPYVLGLIFGVLGLATTTIGRILRPIFGMFPFLPQFVARLSGRNPSHRSGSTTAGRRPLIGRDSAARVIREFEEEYGPHNLPFLETSYSTAFDTAKDDLKFLLVVLLSSEHDDTSSFVRNTLLSTRVVELFNSEKTSPSSMLLWLGNVQDPEAYQVSNALNATKLPFAALIAHTPSVSSTAMSVICRLAGPTPPDDFANKLHAAMAHHADALNGVRATRTAQQATRNIRAEQDSAYERSLAQDRERARVRREAEAAARREEEEARQRAEEERRNADRVQMWRKWRARRIHAEPEGMEGAVRVSLRMGDGERVVRRFSGEDRVEEMYAFVECFEVLTSGELERDEESELDETDLGEYKFGFQLVSPMPREVIRPDEKRTIAEVIGRSGNLIVEKMDEDEE